MSFELRSDQYPLGANDFTVLYMRVNSNNENDWFNCAITSDCFKDKQSAWQALKPVIITMLNACYNEPEVVLR